MKTGTLDQNIGGTPLILLKSLSKLTGNKIYGKAEFLNPGGSIKDRTSLGIIRQAVESGKLKKGGHVYEGTAGNTGIGIAMLAPIFDYKCTIVMPDNQSEEKYQTLAALGANVIKVAPCPFANPNHFYHTAKRMSEQDPGSFWCDQFENLSNFKMHYETTGPEIFNQADNLVDIFCAATGTGGTLAGVSNYLKEQNENTKIVLVDPMGSGLFNYFMHNELKAESSSVTEGIGIMRITANFKKARIDQAMQVNDAQMISMLYYLAAKEGLLVGTSAALNVFAAFQLAKQNLQKNLTIVTVLCDSALRYQSRVFNPVWLKEKLLVPDIHSITI